jgi:hypothetical protein
MSTYIASSGTALDALEGTDIERVARSEQDSVQLHFVDANGTEVCVA